MRKISWALCGLALCAFATPSVAQQSSYVVVATHIDAVRNNQSLFDVVLDCANNELCRAAVADATGIDLGAVSGMAGVLSQGADGEGSFYQIALPDGYSYCSASMKMTSIVPKDGDRGSLFRGVARTGSFYIETWTPELPVFEGRSWVEADVRVIGVRNDLAEWSYTSAGPCYSPNGERSVWYCRGGGCVDTQDRGQSVATSSPPGANSRN